MRYGFGVDLGGTTVKIAYFNEIGKLLTKWEIPTRKEQNGSLILPDIAASIADFISRENIDRSALLGIGIGVPGPVSSEGVVNRCVNLGWGVFNIADELSKLTGLPVKAGNDATVAALGECWMGSGKSYQNLLFVTLGTGVGGGIVANGQVLHGAHGAAAEIGHMIINREETEVSSCGRKGTVEQYCSATGVVRLAKRYLTANPAPSVLREIENLTCKDVFDAGNAGDAAALEILDQVYRYMGEFLANVADVINPEVIVLGGGVSKAGQPLLDGAKKYFDQFVFHANKEVSFALAVLGNDAGAYGAFKLILA